jgi:hypothetical protein
MLTNAGFVSCHFYRTRGVALIECKESVRQKRTVAFLIDVQKGANMFFGKKDKDVRLTDSQYKDLVSHMSKREA